MIFLGRYVIGATNNWKKLHGIPLEHTKRYPHETKRMPKKARVKFHIMKKAGCEEELIARHLLRNYGYDICSKREKSKNEKR